MDHLACPDRPARSCATLEWLTAGKAASWKRTGLDASCTGITGAGRLGGLSKLTWHDADAAFFLSLLEVGDQR